MNLLSLGLSEIPWPEVKTAETISLDTLIRRLDAVFATSSGESVTPENCQQSPTVHAIVTSIQNGISSCPVHVYQKTMSNGRTKKEPQPNHPVEKLLQRPNDWQSPVEYWMDAASTLLRYGRFVAFKARGITGPIRRLIPLHPSAVEPVQDDEYNITYKITEVNGRMTERPFGEIHYVRRGSRDFLKGDSPVMDCREAIALEIAAEKFGASFFGGGAMPGVIFKLMEGFKDFKTSEEKKKFVDDFQAAYGKTGRFRAMLLPKGMDVGQAVGVENDKAQFLETRKLQRTVICGAFNVPVYIAGDTEHQTFNNAEQQSINKVQEVMLPFARIFESAMERDLLTDGDRAKGVIIRFNLDGLLRGDFKTRQDGLNVQRQGGAISANEWREIEGMNPRTDPEGDTYYNQGPSGQTSQQVTAPSQPPIKPNGNANPPSV